MPKVGNIRVSFRKDENPHFFDLFYNQKNKFHIKNVPQHFQKLTEFVSEGYSTEESLKDTLNKCVIEYREKLKTERDVILYKISASSELRMNKVGEGHYSGIKKGISTKISDIGGGGPDCSIGFDYKKCKEIDEGGKKYYPYKDDGTLGYEMRVEKSWNIIEWTSEREDFFAGLYKSMGTMLEKISEFFSNDDEKVLERIDSFGEGTKLLHY